MSHVSHGKPLFYRKLNNKYWRLNNLYVIQDKDGVERLLNLNHAQRVTLLQFRHNKKIILKSRQQGISTLFIAYYLDNCIFKSGYQAGIQSYGRNESNKLKRRALLMWDRIPEEVKDYLGVKLVKSNGDELLFSNGSSLKIGNFRGDTLQGLHVSELAKISKLFPERARELKTGAFQAVSTNSYITIETTAEGDSGLFVDMWETAVAVKDTGRDLTPLDFQPIFLPWFNDPDCNLAYAVDNTEATEKYIERLKRELPDVELTEHQLNWLTIKLDELNDDFDREYPATPEMAFSTSVLGAYYAKQLNTMKRTKRIGKYPYNPKRKVIVSFDLGLNDEMVLLFAQIIGGKVYIIDEYHNSGEGLEFYIEVLSKKGYRYDYLIFPFDINTKDLSTGRSRLEVFMKYKFKYKVLKRVSFQESIEMARHFLLDMSTYIHYDCINLVKSLANYRKKYDKALDVYMERDVHDIHSNYGASLRYMAQGLYVSKDNRKVTVSSSNMAL